MSRYSNICCVVVY